MRRLPLPRCSGRLRSGRPDSGGFGRAVAHPDRGCYVSYMNKIYFEAPLVWGGVGGGSTSGLLDLLVRTDTILGSVGVFRGFPYG